MRRIITATIVAVALCILAGTSMAASTQTLSTGVSLWRGTSKLSDSSNRVVDPATKALTVLMPDNCPGIRDRIIQQDALTRTSGSATYRCQVDLRAAVTFNANGCQPPRAAEKQTVNCPAGTGTFEQTRTWTVAPYPTCEIAGAWLPLAPTDNDCPPTQLPAPTGVTATAISTSEIRVRWNVVPDAVAYSVRRCINATCDPMAFTALRCTQLLEQAHVTLPAGITVRYQIQAARTADCSGELSLPSSPIVSATTFTADTPSEPTIARACSSRVCDVSWMPIGPADGFRIFYSRTNGTWANAPVQVTPGTVTQADVTMPDVGVWYFAVKSFIGGTESPLSNVIVRDVQ